MTLIVSARSAEGIVLAGDTLASTVRTMPVQGNVPLLCGRCGAVNDVSSEQIATVQVPANSFPSSRKIFPFLKRFGIGTYGRAVIGEQTTFMAIRHLEASLEGTRFDSVAECAEAVGEYFALMVVTGPGPGIGFHVNGYDGESPVTTMVTVAPDGQVNCRPESSCPGYTVGGQHQVFVQLLDPTPPWHSSRSATRSTSRPSSSGRRSTTRGSVLAFRRSGGTSTSEQSHLTMGTRGSSSPQSRHIWRRKRSPP